MRLTDEQKQQFYEDGYVVAPGAAREKVEGALRAINASLGSEGIDPASLTRFRAQSYCPELQSSPKVVGLLTDTPVWSFAESAVGEGRIKPVASGQIALRFPAMGAPNEPGPHLDGMYTPTNGVPEGTIANFTALVGVMLSDVPSGYAGNLTVWPGTHRIFESYFRDHGPESLLQGMPKVELPEPVQITGKAGDVVLVHYQVAHGIAGNASPHIRYAVYFRLKHVDHDSLHWECMTDVWREWEGMQDVVNAPARG